MKKLREVFMKVGEKIFTPTAIKVFNVFLGAYAIFCFVGGIFYDLEVNASSTGIWVALVVFNDVMSARIRKLYQEWNDELKDLLDESHRFNINLSERLAEEQSKKK